MKGFAIAMLLVFGIPWAISSCHEHNEAKWCSAPADVEHPTRYDCFD